MGEKREVILFAGFDSEGEGDDFEAQFLKCEDGFLFTLAAQTNLNDFGEQQVVQTNSYNDVLDSASRTATTNSVVQSNYDFKGTHIVINVTSITDTPSVVPVIQAEDSFDANTYYEILRGNAITTTGINILKIYPGITPVPNLAANDILPLKYRLRMEHGDSDAITYTAYFALIK